MITEDYVSFETAKLLKENGFKPETEHELWYVAKEFSTGCHWNSCTYKVGETTREYDRKYCIAMPTLQMAMKWLREVYNIFIQVDYIWSPKELYTYTFDIHNMKSARSIFLTPYGESFNSYEEACEAAIKYCLENLI